MLTLAQSFVLRPKLLLIDELSLGLAPALVQELLAAVRKMNESGITILLVEQSVNIALTLADRAYFMEKGEVKFSGKTAQLLKRRDLLRSVYRSNGSLTPMRKLATFADGEDERWATLQEQLPPQLTTQAREWYLAEVIRIALADGPLSETERQAALAIGADLGMTQAQVVGVVAMTEQSAGRD